MLDQTGYDVLEGLGQNRSQSATQQTPILYSSTSVHPVVHESDDLTIVMDDNLVAGARVDVTLYYALGY